MCKVSRVIRSLKNSKSNFGVCLCIYSMPQITRQMIKNICWASTNVLSSQLCKRSQWHSSIEEIQKKNQQILSYF